MGIGIGFLVTILVLATLIGMVSRFALAGSTTTPKVHEGAILTLSTELEHPAHDDAPHVHVL